MIKKNKKRIALIFATGTVLSIRKNKTIFFVEKPEDVPTWMQGAPELEIIADIKPIFICGESEVTDLETWKKIASFIYSKENDFDGFVVLIRTDKLIYSALTTVFSLQNLSKPIIFTGSQVSDKALEQGQSKELLTGSGLGLKSNVINATQVATEDFPHTVVMYGNRIIEAVRAQKGSLQSLNIFKAIDDEYIGRVDFSINLKRGIRKKEIGDRFVYAPEFTDKVAVLENINLEQELKALDKKKFKAIVIKLEENEQLSESVLESIVKSELPTVVYNYWFVIDQPGLIGISGLTWEAAVIKTMWVAARAKSVGDFKKLMGQNIVGEVLKA